MELAGYHNTQVSWRNGATADDPSLVGKRLVGVEFEHETDYSGHTEKGIRNCSCEFDDDDDYRECYCDAADSQELDLNLFSFLKEVEKINRGRKSDERIVCEEDGSLNGEVGVEAILPPLAPRDVLRKNGIFGRLVKAAAKSRVMDHRPNVDVGMHVNLNTAGQSYEEISATIAVVHEMYPLTKFMAGRESTYAQFSYLNKPWLYAVAGRGAAWARHNRPVTEIRCFQSTINWLLAKSRVRFALSTQEFALENTEEIFQLSEAFSKPLFELPSVGSSLYIDHEDLPTLRKYDAEAQEGSYPVRRYLHTRPSAAPRGNVELIKAYKGWLGKQRSPTLTEVKRMVKASGV